MSKSDAKSRARIEAEAVGYISYLDPADRIDAIANLESAVCALPAWVYACRKEIETAPAAPLGSLWAILDRPGMEYEKERTKSAGLTLEILSKLDPARARNAYQATLDEAAAAGEARRMETAAREISEAMGTKDPETRDRLRQGAIYELLRAGTTGDSGLTETWDSHVQNIQDGWAETRQVIRLAPERGVWGQWFNDCLGPRSGLEPGQTMVLCGEQGTGKTSLAALIAVDALSAGCPVTFWQLELSRAETLEHLQAQRHDIPGWPHAPFPDRAQTPFPEKWDDLLSIPRWPEPEVETVIDACMALSSKAKRTDTHDCSGLLIVDYAQLLTLRDSAPRQNQHEILSTAVSRLAKTVSETGSCALILSYPDRPTDQASPAGEIASSGSALLRMAHRAAIIENTAGGQPCGPSAYADFSLEKGETRRLTWLKTRGTCVRDGSRPGTARDFYAGGAARALTGD